MFPSNTSPWGSGNPTEEVKTVEMEGMEHTRNHSLLYTAEPMPAYTPRDCDHLYRANRVISQMWSKCWEGSRHDPPSRNQKLSSFDHCLERENECSLIKFHQICKSLLWPSPMPNSKWPTQDQFDGNLLYSVVGHGGYLIMLW